MKRIQRIGAALAAATFIPLGSLAMPASAQAAAPGLLASVQSQGRWINLGHDSHTPIKVWRVKRQYKSQSKTLQVVFRCWDGGDKTKIMATLFRVVTGDVGWPVKSSNWQYCGNGVKHYLKIKAKKGTNYQVMLELKGHKHTIEYWMQNEL
ncbi:hypothetical protein [Nonomuraea basaltis]|uniref:hypothetical protein n=1 Tax=Nonomuraea basaltis TaxID=2495887 RepID=UPI00110C6055|nr:hypothetical protein [Nonomuraea basaltis]TMR93285.1 hypothetical protein EJK15_39980 [Nonomuraea basaltis]